MYLYSWVKCHRNLFSISRYRSFTNRNCLFVGYNCPFFIPKGGSRSISKYLVDSGQRRHQTILSYHLINFSMTDVTFENPIQELIYETKELLKYLSKKLRLPFQKVLKEYPVLIFHMRRIFFKKTAKFLFSSNFSVYRIVKIPLHFALNFSRLYPIGSERVLPSYHNRQTRFGFCIARMKIGKYSFKET